MSSCYLAGQTKRLFLPARKTGLLVPSIQKRLLPARKNRVARSVNPEAVKRGTVQYALLFTSRLAQI